jgi:hypothetical protein
MAEHSDEFEHKNVVLVATIIGAVVFLLGAIGLIGTLG